MTMCSMSRPIGGFLVTVILLAVSAGAAENVPLLTKDPQIEKIDPELLLGLLQEYVKERGLLDLVLQADKDVSHGNVVQIMDLAKSAGVNSIIIAARWKAEGLQ